MAESGARLIQSNKKKKDAPGLQTWWRRYFWAGQWAPHTASGRKQTSGALRRARSGPCVNNCWVAGERKKEQMSNTRQNQYEERGGKKANCYANMPITIKWHDNHIKMTGMSSNHSHTDMRAIIWGEQANGSPSLLLQPFISLPCWPWHLWEAIRTPTQPHLYSLKHRPHLEI